MAPATTGSYRSVAAQDVNVPKFFSTKINVSNLEKSLDFYTRIMGLKVTARVGNDRFAEIVLTRTGEGAGGVGAGVDSRLLGGPGEALRPWQCF